MRSHHSPRGYIGRLFSSSSGCNRRSKTRRRDLVKSFGEQLEPRLLLTTAAMGDQFAVAETLDSAGTPAAIAVHGDGSFTTAWESFEEDGSGFGVFAQR